jgi:hypothetical protein
VIIEIEYPERRERCLKKTTDDPKEGEGGPVVTKTRAKGVGMLSD